MEIFEQLQNAYTDSIAAIDEQIKALQESKVKVTDDYNLEVQVAFEAYDKQRQAMLDEEVKKVESERGVASVAGYATKKSMKKIRSLKEK
mgnify:CR=1 FL=1